MYPETPKITPEHLASIRYWLNIAGSDAKGCRNRPIRVTLAPKVVELARNDSVILEKVHAGWEIVDDATNNALEVDNDEASHIPGLGNDE